jgi:outer membrane protein OmpA-like peptidoglycan-associated protein
MARFVLREPAMVRTTRYVPLLLLASSVVARADDFSLKVEPGVSMPLSAPQSTIYNDGGSQSIKALYGLTSYLDIGPAISFMLLPAATEGMESGVAWGFGGGARLKRPHDAISSHGVSPWVDGDIGVVRSGELTRLGWDAAVGLAIPVDDARRYWVGPFLRYSQTGQQGRAGYDDRDAKVLTLGVSVELTTPTRRKSLVEESRVVDAAPAVLPTAAPAVCADRDADTIPDAIDHCPDVAGLMDNWGCPNYSKLVVKKDKLELKEKLYFAWDRATLEDASLPVLDEVVQALKDNQGFRVQVEGHTSSEGGDDHNQTLSEQRADAVLDYLVSHGIAKDRLVSKGFASSVPIDTNTTPAGRENNRRVEFVVNFVILSTEGAK